MELPLVTSNMRSTIENIRTEFGNIAHLTDNDLPKDAQGQDVDLAALWIEFMDRQLDRFTHTGKDRLREMIQTGTEAFKAELVVMKGWLKKISKTPSNAVKQRHNAAVRQYKIEKNNLKGDKRTLKIAEKKVVEELGAIEKKFNGVQVDIEKEKKKQGTPYSNAVKSMKSAIKEVTESEQKVGTAVRKILEHDKDDLPKQIQNWKAIIAQLQKFEADRLKIKVLKAQ